MRVIDVIAVISLTVATAATLPETQGVHLPTPTRELEWKEVNFLSISDTHGWLLGHQHATWPEPNYSGDYGDFASFTEHMRSIASKKGVDLLLVDAGDHHDGSGLVSSSTSSAERADEIFGMLKYDVMTIGNHELYAYGPARWIYDNIDRFEGRYLTSNAEILVKDDGKEEYRPIGERYRIFDTLQGRKVTAFGIIFDFKAHGRGIKVQAPREMVTEPWFLEAIHDTPDYFILAGHMPVRGQDADFGLVIETIRQRHPHVPVYVFGGHTHVRDCVTFDDHSIGVVPGRYMETIAFTSSSLPGTDAPLDLTRRYIDANRQSYKHHSKSTDHTFDTALGHNITVSLLRLASSLDISSPLGKAPQDLFLARYPIGHPAHLVTQFGDVVLPAVLQDEERKGGRLIIANTGTLRFDLFQGRFDRNDELTVSPFASGFLYVPLPAGLAGNITSEMNRAGASKFIPDTHPTQTRHSIEDRVDRVYNEWMAEQWENHVSLSRDDGGSSRSQGAQVVFGGGGGGKGDKRTMGYVTKDACPGIGDDIDHVPVPHHGYQPDFFSSPLPSVHQDETIDVVICDFALDDFLIAVNKLAPSLDLKAGDMQVYAEGIKVSEAWGIYARQNWR